MKSIFRQTKLGVRVTTLIAKFRIELVCEVYLIKSNRLKALLVSTTHKDPRLACSMQVSPPCEVNWRSTQALREENTMEQATEWLNDYYCVISSD